MTFAARKSTNISLDQSLLAEAKALDINISRAAEEGVAKAVAARRAEEWMKEHAAALDSSNEYVRKHGLPLAKYRQF